MLQKEYNHTFVLHANEKENKQIASLGTW